MDGNLKKNERKNYKLMHSKVNSISYLKSYFSYYFLVRNLKINIAERTEAIKNVDLSAKNDKT